jgi:hypothetical protein
LGDISQEEYETLEEKLLRLGCDGTILDSCGLTYKQLYVKVEPEVDQMVYENNNPPPVLIRHFRSAFNSSITLILQFVDVSGIVFFAGI